MENKSCWGCEHMDPRDEFMDDFYCHKLNRWFSKQSEDDVCDDFKTEKGTKMEIRW